MNLLQPGLCGFHGQWYAPASIGGDEVCFCALQDDAPIISYDFIRCPYIYIYTYIYTYTQDAQGGHGDDSDMTKTKTIYTYTSTLHHSTMPTRWINSLMIQPFQRQQIIGSTQLWFFKRRWPRGPGVLGSSRLELGSARPPAWFQLLRACTGLMRLLALTTAAYFASWPLLSEPAGVDKQPGVCMF